MAGGYNHCCDEAGNYRGVDLLENMGDMHEAVEEMFFIINYMARENPFFGERPMTKIERAREAYFRCLRKEEPWPDWMGMKNG